MTSSCTPEAMAEMAESDNKSSLVMDPYSSTTLFVDEWGSVDCPENVYGNTAKLYEARLLVVPTKSGCIFIPIHWLLTISVSVWLLEPTRDRREKQINFKWGIRPYFRSQHRNIWCTSEPVIFCFNSLWMKPGSGVWNFGEVPVGSGNKPPGFR